MGSIGGAGIAVRVPTPGEDTDLADLLALAFRDNPLNRAVIAGDARRRLRANRAGMRLSLACARSGGRADWLVADDPDRRPVGALIGLPPGAFPLPSPGLGAGLRCLLVQGPRVLWRWGAIHEALQPDRPVHTHATLFIVGVHPERRGRGLGGALVGRWLEGLDARGEPAHLETDRRESVGFYRGLGFEVADEASVLGVPIWSMRRPSVRG